MKILVPVDGSPASTRALALAIAQLKPLVGAGLILVNVQNFATLGLAEGAGIMSTAWIEQEEEKAATEALQEAVAACREAGVTYVTRSERGPVAASHAQPTSSVSPRHVPLASGFACGRLVSLGPVEDLAMDAWPIDFCGRFVSAFRALRVGRSHRAAASRVERTKLPRLRNVPKIVARAPTPDRTFAVLLPADELATIDPESA